MKSLYENLTEPAPLEEGALRVIPLGGLGEVGRNMNVLEYRGKLLVVDCGVLFPEESQPGVDLILPDFSWIEDRMGDVVDPRRARRGRAHPGWQRLDHG